MKYSMGKTLGRTRGKTLGRAVGFFLIMSVICGVLYTGVCLAVGQLAFPFQANGSIIEIDANDDGEPDARYSLLLGQQFTDDDHMWGRPTNYNLTTFTNDEGKSVAWAGPSNLSPASKDYEQLVAERVEKIRAAHPERGTEPIPSDLVTASGSGLDPDISPAAAEYQVERLAKNTGKSEDEIRAIIEACTEQPTLGLLGEARVNVLKVNLMLDGVLS